jgi:hypothetical protein
MARQPSKILSPADKKAAIADLKAQLKVAKDEHKQHTSFGKEKEKLHAATMKQNAKDVATAQKAIDGIQKQIDALAA